MFIIIIFSLNSFHFDDIIFFFSPRLLFFYIGHGLIKPFLGVQFFSLNSFDFSSYHSFTTRLLFFFYIWYALCFWFQRAYPQTVYFKFTKMNGCQWNWKQKRKNVWVNLTTIVKERNKVFNNIWWTPTNPKPFSQKFLSDFAALQTKKLFRSFQAVFFR